MTPRYILGLSGFYHDSAACLLRDGDLVAAAQEERFTRKKGDESFPARAAAFCLAKAGIDETGLDAVVFYEKPLLKFDRLIETYIGLAPRGFASFRPAAPLWMKERLYIERAIRTGLNGYKGKLLYAEHHESHAASAFLPSPFDSAAILTVDGVGEWATATIGAGNGNKLAILRELQWPDSLGLLYSAFTYHAGFKVNSGEYKVMGLAPYGEPRFVSKIYELLLDLRDDGSFRLNQDYFDYMGGLVMTSAAFAKAFGGPPRVPESPLTQREMDLARSVQDVCEEIVLRMARTAHKLTGEKSLCLAGGVALNAVANGRLLREGPFERIWIQPAAGDAGASVGAAMLAECRYFEGRRGTPGQNGDRMKNALLGPDFPESEIRSTLDGFGAVYETVEDADLFVRTAKLLAAGMVIGWFQGRMEFGPRALGARSILADARDPEMQSKLNLKIKFREGFRPFAPSVLKDSAGEYFELEGDSPYMLIVAPVAEKQLLAREEHSKPMWGIDRLNVPRSRIPAVTHLDGSARIQTVEEENGRFYLLLKEFHRTTGCPVLVNTSFNVRGEPIVCTPADAYRCFMRTNLDFLVVGNHILRRKEQPPLESENEWRTAIPTD